MSAIFGIFNRNGRPVEPALLERMAATLAHRGPDGSGMWVDGAVGLGHMMHWSTPESLGERLPLAHPRGDLVITADARIDNREELLARLNLCDRPAGMIPDSELILAAYERWGEDCPRHLLGDFTFVIWDARQRKLFCARDHFAIKPFYYYNDEHVFAFASELKSLRMLPWVSDALCEQWVAEYLTSTIDTPTITPFHDILRLPGSHSVVVLPDYIQQQRYWELDPQREIAFSSDAEYAAAFRDIFAEAVRCRMRSNRTVGSTLSGGLDSSSIACMARLLRRTHGQGSLPTFSLAFRDVLSCSEKLYIDAAIAQGGFVPHHVYGDQVGPWTDRQQMQLYSDSPVYAGNAFLLWALFKAARQADVGVLLEGYDGDTVVSHGTGYIIELARDQHWLTFWREARGYSNHFRHSTSQVAWPFIWKYGLDPLVPQGVRPLARGIMAARQKLLPSSVTSDSTKGLINVQLARRIHFADYVNTTRKIIQESERADHHISLQRGLLQYLAEGNASMAAAFGIEVRHPFWDRRLVEFCLALPASQKLRHGFNRHIMRRAMSDQLPEAILHRGGKADMAPCFAHGLYTFGQSCVQWTVQHADSISDYVNADALQLLYRLFTDRSASGAELATLWKIGSFASWLHDMHGGYDISIEQPVEQIHHATQPKLFVPTGNSNHYEGG